MSRVVKLGIACGLVTIGLGGSAADAQVGVQFHMGNHHDDHRDHWQNRHQGNVHVAPRYENTEGGFYVESGTYYYRPYGRRGPRIVIREGSFAYVDELAERLENELNLLCLDMHDNYRHNPGFSETYEEAYQMLDLARDIYASDHEHDREAIAQFVSELDPLFRHVASDIRHWNRRTRHRWGQGGLQSKLNRIQPLIDHLTNTVGRQAPSPDGYNGPIAPPPES